MLLTQPFQSFLYVCLTTDTYYLLSLYFYSTNNSWILAVHLNYAKFMKTHTQFALHAQINLYALTNKSNLHTGADQYFTLHVQLK